MKLSLNVLYSQSYVFQGFLSDINTVQIQGRKDHIETSTEGFLLDNSLLFNYGKSISTTTPEETHSHNKLNIPDDLLVIQLRKRDITETDLIDQVNPEESTDAHKEARASSIPYLPKQESEGQSGSGGGLIPGLPSIPGLPDSVVGGSSNTPMAVIGGFQMVLMPMPGLTMSNIGSAMQAGQQFSQLVPGMPSLPG